MQQAAVLRRQQENHAVDQPQQLSEEIRQGQRARVHAVTKGSVAGMAEESVSERLERLLDTVAQPFARRLARLLPAVPPPFQNTIGGGCPRRPESAGMHQKPKSGEVGQCVRFEDSAQIGLDIGGPGQAGVVAQQPQPLAVAGQAPQGAIVAFEPVLQGKGSRGAASVFAGQDGAGPVKPVAGRDNDDGHAPAQSGQRHARVRREVLEAEHVPQQRPGKVNRCGMRGARRGGKIREQRLSIR